VLLKGIALFGKLKYDAPLKARDLDADAYVTVPSALVVLYPLPDLSAHVLTIVPLLGSIPVPAGSEPSSQS
jgi:hypothetical protein